MDNSRSVWKISPVYLKEANLKNKGWTSWFVYSSWWLKRLTPRIAWGISRDAFLSIISFIASMPITFINSRHEAYPNGWVACTLKEPPGNLSIFSHCCLPSILWLLEAINSLILQPFWSHPGSRRERIYTLAERELVANTQSPQAWQPFSLHVPPWAGIPEKAHLVSVSIVNPLF